MRVIVLVTSCLLLWAPHAWSQIAPEQVGTATLPEPGENWIAGVTRMGAYIYDADTGDMQGLISLSGYTSGFEVDRVRRQVYAPEMYYSRGVHGERTDVVTIYDFDNLSPVAEIEVPQKIAVLRFRRHVGMLGDNRHFLVFNMTPAQSVTVVDVEDREFVGEISTPGCSSFSSTSRVRKPIASAARRSSKCSKTRSSTGPSRRQPGGSSTRTRARLSM